MECQNTIKNLKINKDKAVGLVVIIVEGEKEEFKVLKHIFTKILDYDYRYIKRSNILHDEYRSNNDKNIVLVINTKNSNIGTVISDENYKKQLKKLLKKEYNKNLKNVPIYIVWDRDKEKKDDKKIQSNYLKAIETFYSAYDNEYEMNGLLILSYPCVENYIISNFKKTSNKDVFISSQQCKSELKKLNPNINDINEKSLLLAAENMHKGLIDFRINSYDPSNLERINKIIFRKEEEIYKLDKNIKSLSLISMILIDLQIIEEK